MLTVETTWESPVPNEDVVKIAVSTGAGYRKYYFVKPRDIYDLIITYETKAHEIYRGPCKLVLDLEYKLKEGEDFNAYIEEFECSLVQTAMSILQACGEKEYLVLDCHRFNKMSSHVVFPTIWFRDASLIPNWLKKNIEIPPYLDMNIYGKMLRFPLALTDEGNYRLIPRTPIEDEVSFLRYCCTLTTETPEKFVDAGTVLQQEPQVDVNRHSRQGMYNARTDDLLRDMLYSQLIKDGFQPARSKGGNAAFRISGYPCIYKGKAHASNEMFVFAEICRVSKRVVFRCLCLDPECTKKGRFDYVVTE